MRSTNSCQGCEQLSPETRAIFRRAVEIPAAEHLRVAAEASRCVDEGVSKTINLAAGATREEVSGAFEGAWHLGMKAISVYRDGTRPHQPEDL